MELEAVAVDGVEYLVPQEDDRAATILSWHPPGSPPHGRPFGATGVCFAASGIVLISSDGVAWDFPGGRPEGDETWEMTLRRELLEEACATVESARLIGFCRLMDTDGPVGGQWKVRSMWRAEVLLGDWAPEFEITHRRLVDPQRIRSELTIPSGAEPIYERTLREAGVL